MCCMLELPIWCTHKCLRVHQKCEETSSAASSSQSCVHGAPQHVLVTVSCNWTNAHACLSLFLHARGHGELNITSLSSGQCCLSSWMSSGYFASKLSISGSCLAYSTMYSPHMSLSCDVVLVSAVLYPRTIKHAYSCSTARAVRLTAYTVNALHQPLNSLLWYVPSSRYIWSSAPMFCFCKNK